MIISKREGQLQTILQTDHAQLSGFLAEHWGNATFARPEPLGPMCQAARLHDNGWSEYEVLPRANPKTGLPYQFPSRKT